MLPKHSHQALENIFQNHATFVHSIVQFVEILMLCDCNAREGF